VRGVAPRFAVALPGGAGGPASLVVADGTPCLFSSVEESLTCLRKRTADFLAGPALAVYPSSLPGITIQVGVHVRDPSLRRRVGYGIAALLQRRDGDRWRPVYHLLNAPSGVSSAAPVPFGAKFAVTAIGLVAGRARTVLLPDVEPGLYRIAQRVSIGSRGKWLFANLMILPKPPATPCPPATACTHA